MDPAAGGILKTLVDLGGIYGLVIFGLGAAVVMLWRHTNRQQAQLIELQNLRVDEAKAVRKELMEFSQKYNEAIGNLTAAVNALKDVVVFGIKRSEQ